MPVFEDWLNDPLSIVNNIFDSDPVNFDQKVNEYFEAKLNSEKNYYSIPCLNEAQIHELKPNCLVRYRCMIQDSFDPIYYAGIQKLKNNSTNETLQMTFKYKEHLEIPEGFVAYNEYFEHSENLKSTDSLENAMDNHFSQKNQVNLQQRMTFYCVPIPGETEWVKQVYKSNSPATAVNSFGSSSNISHRPSKRAIDSNESSEEIVIDSCLSEVTNNKLSEESRTNTNDQTLNRHTSNTTKKTKTEDYGETKLDIKLANDLNFPLASNETGHACLVKLYENFDQFKINDIVEFIGVLSQEPSLAYEVDENGDMHHQNFQMSEKLMREVTLEENSMETDDPKDTKSQQKNTQVLSSFPPSLVPRLHCLKSYRLMHNNPYMNKELLNVNIQAKKIDQNIQNEYWNRQHKMFLTNFLNNSESLENSKVSPGIDSTLIENSRMHVMSLRKEIVSCFQEMLLGDSLAAEYLLMHLLSTVFMRKDVTVLGKFSLNLTNIPLSVLKGVIQHDENKVTSINETFTNSFYKALTNFVTMSHKFDFTIENLNKSNLIPTKDYNKNKLITGMLQLPEKFELVLDETKLNAGELNSKGLMNFNSIKDIISSQKVNYDFNYHQQEFPTNLRVLSLSDTKSILPFDCTLKINHNVEFFDSSAYESIVLNLVEKRDSNLLKNFRNYLSIVSNLEYTIPDTVQKVVEEDIVNIKKDFISSSSNKTNSTMKGKVIDIDAIHLILIVARLQSLSYGRTELSLREWNAAKSLEFERLHNRV